MQISFDPRAGIATLKRTRDRVKDLSPAFEGPVNEAVTVYLIENFASEGFVGLGRRWAELSESTLKGRKLPGHGKGGIGRDTDKMYEALLAQKPRVTPTTYERGAPDATVPVYYKWFTGGNRDGVQPARNVFVRPTPPALLKKVAEIVNRYVFSGELSAS